jgi:uroporphyrinogen-III synthase
MPSRRTVRRDLRGQQVLVARPAGRAAALVRAARARGARAFAIPTASLRVTADPAAARAGLAALRDAAAIVFTSSAAVRHAWALAPRLRVPRALPVLGVGPATVKALRRRGVAAQAPAGRYDSEGLLAHPALRAPRGATVAVVTAPDGRGLLQGALRARGLVVREVHVYRRVVPRLDARHHAALRACGSDAVLLVSSADAVTALAALLDRAAFGRLARGRAVAASERVAATLRAAGFRRVRVARSALGADLLEGARPNPGKAPLD